MAVSTDPGDIKDTDAVGHNLGDERLSTGTNDNYSLSDADKAKFDDIAKNYDHDESSDGSSGSGKSGSNSSSSQVSGKSSISSSSSSKSNSSSSSSSSSSGPSSKFGAAIRLRRNKSGNFALIAVVVAAILCGGFFSILPLKLESMMKNIIEHRIEGRLKHYMRSRLETKIKKYVKDSVGESKAEFEKNIADDDPATKDFEQEYEDANADQALEEQDRITLTKAGDAVDVARDGETLGTIDEVSNVDNVLNGMMNITHGLQDMYRAPLRWMASTRYGIAKWKFFNDEQDPEKANAEVTTELVADASIQVGEGDVAAIDCALSEGSCPDDESNNDPSQRVVQEAPDAQASKTGGAGDQTVEGAVQQAEGDATNNAKSYLSKLSYLNYLNPNHYIAVAVSKLLTKYLSAEVTQLVSKAFSAAAGPLLIIAAVDIASRIDHFLWYGGADKVLVNIHKIQYAAQFIEWGIIDSQWKSGQNVSGAEFNSVNGMLNGTENSAASRTIYGTGTGGQSLYQTDSGETTATSRSIDEHATPIADEYKNLILPAIAGPLQAIPIAAPGGLNASQGAGDAIHYLLLAWYDSLGKVWGLLQKILSLPVSLILKAIRLIPGVGSTIDWLMQHIGYILGSLVSYIIKPAVDGTEVGADLMNGIDAGGAVVGMDFARTLGGHLLTPTQSSSLNKEIADEQVQDASHMSLATRLFSTDYAQSGINLLALQMPSTTSGVIGNSLSYAASMFTNPFQAFTPALQVFGLGKANADALYDDQYGLNDWGYTDQDLQVDDSAQLTQAYQNAAKRLNEPVANVHLNAVELDDCPTPADPDHNPNVCRLDIATLRSMSAAFDNTDDGGLNSPW